MLVAQGLVKAFGSRTAVDNVDIEIAAGEIYGVRGDDPHAAVARVLDAAGLLHDPKLLVLEAAKLLNNLLLLFNRSYRMRASFYTASESLALKRLR